MEPSGQFFLRITLRAIVTANAEPPRMPVVASRPVPFQRGSGCRGGLSAGNCAEAGAGAGAPVTAGSGCAASAEVDVKNRIEPKTCIRRGLRPARRNGSRGRDLCLRRSFAQAAVVERDRQILVQREQFLEEHRLALQRQAAAARQEAEKVRWQDAAVQWAYAISVALILAAMSAALVLRCIAAGAAP